MLPISLTAEQWNQVMNLPVAHPYNQSAPLTIALASRLQKGK